MKKVLSVVLAVTMVLSLFAGINFTASAGDLDESGKCGDNVSWSFDSSTGTVTISGSGAMKDYTGYSGSPFYNGRSNIKNIIINAGITSIGNYAFYGCGGLKNVTIPNSVTSIGVSAFYSCYGLTDITIPESVTSIDTAAFWSCSGLTSIKIPDRIKIIKNHTFYGCDGLKSVTIPNGVTNIELYAFRSCSGLTSVTIPNSVVSIDTYAFADCVKLTSITIPDSVKTIDKCAFNTLKNITIPVTYKIDFSCFENCDNIQVINLTSGADGNMVDWSTDYADSLWYLHKNTVREINLSEGIKTISDSAFYGCSNLSKTNIPSTVTKIGRYAYSGCSNLRDITFNSVNCIIPNDKNTIDEFATIYGYDNSTAQAYAKTYGRTFVSLGKYNCIQHKEVIDKAIPASCTTDGKTEGSHCSVCGYVINAQRILPAHGHDYQSKKTPAGAATLGYTTNTCARCGDTFVDSYTAPTGKLTLKHSARTANAIKVQWNNVKSATGYQVQISTKDGKKWDKTVTLKAGVTSYTFKKLAAGNNYKFRVRFYIKAEDGKNYFSPWSKTLNSPTLPSGTTLTKLSSAKKAFTAQWKKNASVNGYQLQYGVKSNFSGAKTLTVKNAKTLKAAVKKLSAKKTYYVRIRTYKTISKVNYFSSWSKAYKVKTK